MKRTETPKLLELNRYRWHVESIGHDSEGRRTLLLTEKRETTSLQSAKNAVYWWSRSHPDWLRGAKIIIEGPQFIHRGIFYPSQTPTHTGYAIRYREQEPTDVYRLRNFHR